MTFYWSHCSSSTATDTEFQLPRVERIKLNNCLQSLKHTFIIAHPLCQREQTKMIKSECSIMKPSWMLLLFINQLCSFFEKFQIQLKKLKFSEGGFSRFLLESEKSHLLFKGKYHCTNDLPFDWFGFDQTCKSLSNSTWAKQLNPNQSNRRSFVQWYSPVWSKWVFFAWNVCLLNIGTG